MKFEKISKYLDNDDVILPRRATAHSAGYDLRAAEDILVPARSKPVLVPTGLKVKLDPGYYLSISARSSLALKRKIIVPNAPGIIDADYYNNESNEGHIFVQLLNLDEKMHEIKKGEAIAQGIILKYHTVENDDSEGVREGGFGSTGI